MDAISAMETSTLVYETDVSRAVRALGAALKVSPEMEAFQAAIQSVNADDAAQDMLRQIRTLQTTLYWGQGNPADHSALHELQAGLEARPSIQAYYRAEQAARELFQAVDAVVREAAGVEFAANAKRSCCGG